MPQAVLAGFLVLHGFITTRIGVVAVADPTAPALVPPAWLAWWPGPIGRSWVFDSLQLGSGAAVAGGILWLAAGLALIGAGLGWFGIPVLQGAWQTLAVGGAVVGLAALALYFHPIYLIAIAINLAIVALASGVLAPAR
jgi:hypothetical protein